MQESLIILDFVLIFLITLAALVGLKEREAVNIYIFCLFTLVYNSADGYIPHDYGSVSYIGAALNDLLIIYVLSKLIHISEVTLKIQRICKLFITVNFCGWIMYMLYEPPIYYNVLCTALYLYTLYSTTKIGVRNVLGNHSMDWRLSRIFSHTHSSSHTTKANQKEARN